MTQERYQLFRIVVGAIVLLFDTLPSDALARLLHLEKGEMDRLLGPLGSVIHIPERHNIRLFHPSFRDFLIDPARCIGPRFLIDEPESHMNIFISCRNLMSTGLQRDICSLKRPGVLTHEISKIIIRDHLSPDIQYACSHWVHHVKECQTKALGIGSGVGNRILEFFQTHLLHWLEVLSLIQKLSEGVLALQMLQNIIKVSLLLTISDCCI